MLVHDLCKLLVSTTTELLNAFQEKHADGLRCMPFTEEIQEIREALRIRRADFISVSKNKFSDLKLIHEDNCTWSSRQS